MIVTGSRLNSNGSVGDVMFVCPSAWIGSLERSTWSILPSVRLLNVAVAVTSSRLSEAVNGFASTNVVCARPVWTMSVGKTSDAVVMRF